MVELLGMRQENTKTFDLGDNKRQLVASIGAIHYKDNYADTSEQWKDIDLTWVGNKITKAPYELTLDGQKITIRNKKNNEVSTIELTDVKPAGMKFEIVPENTRVSFRHILLSDKIPFEAKFKVTGKGLINTKAFDDDGELVLETAIIGDVLTEKLSSIIDKQTGQVRPAKGFIHIDPTWQVAASTDDCYRRLVPTACSYTTLYCGVGASGADYYQYGGGMRFTNITISKGVSITQSYLTFRCQTAKSGTICKSRISAEDVDDAPTFTDDAATFDARWANRTTARMAWDAIPAWTLNSDYGSPITDGTTTFASIIQEVIDRELWASGNDIVIFWEDFEDRSTDGAERRAYSYDGSTTNAPKLYVEYTVSPDYPQSASVDMGLAATASRAISTARSASTSLGTGLTVSRAIKTARASSTSLGTGLTVSRAWGRYRTASHDLGLSPTASRVITIARTASHALGLVPSITKNFGKSASLALGLAATASRIANFPRIASHALGLAITTSRAIAINRTSLTNLGLDLTVSRAISVARSASVAMGLVASVLKGIGLTASTSLGLAVTASRAIVVSRTASHEIGLAITAARSRGINRLSSLTLGLTSTASRAIAISRTASQALGMAVTASRITAIARTASHSLGLSATASRVIAITRTASHTLGLAATASRAITVARTASHAIGFGLDVARSWGRYRDASVTIGYYTLSWTSPRIKRRISTTGTNRTITDTGTNRDRTDTGTNRDREPW